MARPPAHKPLVDALVDGEATTREVATRAVELGKTHEDRLANAFRAILKGRADGRVTAERAKTLWREVWLVLSLGVFATVAKDIVEAEKDYVRALEEARKLGPEKLKVSPIREADHMERAQEKANG